MIVLCRTPISATHATMGPLMIIGISETDILAVDGDGQMAWYPTGDVKVDWRYDWHEGLWVDVSPYEEIDGNQETPDDRGEEVPGDLSDADGADGGREGGWDGPVDQADRGVVPGEAEGDE